MSIRPTGQAGPLLQSENSGTEENLRVSRLRTSFGFNSLFEASPGYMRSCLKKQGFALLWFVFPTTSYNFVTWTKIKLPGPFPFSLR